MTIEELLERHFLIATDELRRDDPGRPMTQQEAVKFCQILTPRQRTGLHPDVLDALNTLFDETKELFKKRDFRYSAVSELKALDWWKGQRSPQLEQSWTTVAVLYGRLQRMSRINGINMFLWASLSELLQRLQKRPLRLDASQVLLCLESSCDKVRNEFRFDYALLSPTLKSALKLMKDDFTFDTDRQFLSQVRAQLVNDGYGASSRAHSDWIASVIEEEDPELLWTDEPWAAQVKKSIEALPEPTRAAAIKLLKYAGTARESAKPAKAWIAAAKTMLDAFGREPAAQLFTAWLRSFASDERKAAAELRQGYRLQPGERSIATKLQTNTGYIAGVIHLAGCVADANIFSVLCDIVENIGRAKHGVRTISWPVAIAAIRAIESSDHELAAASLSRLTLRLRWPKIRKAAEKAFEQYIARNGLSRDDVEETSAPDFGMKNGAVTIDIGDSRAELAIGRTDRPRTTWFRPGKEPTHVVPKALKQAHPETVGAVSQMVDDIEKAIAVQRTRIDLLFRRQTAWPYDAFRQRYLDHGLIATLAHRLIWLIDGVPMLHAADAWEDVLGRPVDTGDSAQVMLWHPALRPTDEIVAWRQRLETLGITQPLKQVHREVYLLTDAERRTQTYSNRFAAHIVRNQVTLAISQVRKWKMGLYGGESSPSLALPHFGLRAEWWVQAAGEEQDRMGFPLYLVTDQVRIYREGAAEPMRLEEVPQLAFTEVMRDVDLFVGMGSVGNDPTWRDGGPTERYRDYWTQYSFGDLNETAKTRKVVLERLIPRLKIAARCSLVDKFLVVRGEIRTYKIHLGSGNILMEPNDQYLCIVPNRSTSEKNDLFLPFEGDSTLSVIISKAFLLAEDMKISDPTITRQIKGG